MAFQFNSAVSNSRPCAKISFMQILATAYIRHEPWEMGVHKRNGVVYLDVHKLPERPQSDLDRRRYTACTSFYFIRLSLVNHVNGNGS